jgi:hypothetical protein
MNNLLYKEFKLSVHLTSYLFLPLGLMLLIPNYPYAVAFFYQTLGVFFMFLNGNTNNDIYFTALLPIRKRDAVKARVLVVIIFELLQIVTSVPIAMLRNTFMAPENAAGMDLNAAFYGLVFVMFGIFNMVFLPAFYKTAYKTGQPFVLACIAMTAFVGIAEAAIHLVPGWQAVIDTTDPTYLPQQAAVLLAGIVLAALLTVLSTRQSIKRFEQLDL